MRSFAVILNLVLPASIAGRTRASCVIGQPLGLAVVPDVYIIIAMSRIFNRERLISIVSSVTFSLTDSKVSWSIIPFGDLPPKRTIDFKFFAEVKERVSGLS